MFSRRWYIAPLVAVLVIALLALGGYAIHRASWEQGYAMGVVATGGEEAAPAPYARHRFGLWSYGYPGRLFGHSPFLSGLGLVIAIVGLITVGRCIAHLLFFRTIRRYEWSGAQAGEPPVEGAPQGMPMYGPAGRAWARRWYRMRCHTPHRGWGHVPPWFYGREEETQEDQAAEDATEPEPES